MNEAESELKYEPFSNKKMIAFSLGGMIGGLMWSVRGMFQLYAQKGLGITFYM